MGAEMVLKENNKSEKIVRVMFPRSSLDVKSQGQVENKTSEKEIVRVVFRDREDAGGGRET